MNLSLLITLLCYPIAITAAIGQDKPDLSKVPEKVRNAVNARFPNAEIVRVSEETEGEKVVYDFEFLMSGKRFEADINEDGSIHNWEMEISAADLSATVRRAVEMRFPGATVKEVMQITVVNDGDEALEGYEILLETSDMKKEEITVAPDGKVLEDTGKSG